MKKMHKSYPVDRDCDVWCVVCRKERPKDRKWKYKGKITTQLPTDLSNIVHYECGKKGVLFYRFDVVDEKEKVAFVKEQRISILDRLLAWLSF